MTELLGVLRTDAGTAQVSFTRDYDTDVADLWSALTEPDRLARWLARPSGDFRPGGRVQVHFDDGDGEFEIETCEPPTHLAVHWVHDASTSRVTAAVTARPGGGCTLVLEHSALTPEQAPQYGAGWHWHLDALAAVLGGEEPGEWRTTFDELLVTYRAAAAG